MEVIAKLSHEKLNGSINNNPNLVLTLKAPHIEWMAKRPPICILGLIDLSGSMRGTKIEGVKNSLLKMLEHLIPGDIMSLVGFNSSAILITKTPVVITSSNKSDLMEAIGKLRPGGSTNLWDGVLEALKQMQDMDIPNNYVKRVVMFTDGQPNEGITSTSTILKLLAEKRGDISFSAFGYDSPTFLSPIQSCDCDHNFLRDFSTKGGGNYSYVQNEESTLAAFGRELGGLCSTYAQNILVEVSPQKGHTVTSVVSDIDCAIEPLGETSFKVDNLLSEEERSFVFNTAIQKSDTGPRAVNVFNVKVEYTIFTSSGDKQTKTFETKVKAQFVTPGNEQKEIEPGLSRVISLAKLVRTQLEAQTAVREGRPADVPSIFSSYKQGLSSEDFNLLNLASKLETATISNQNLYTSNVTYGITRGRVNNTDSDANKDLLATGIEAKTNSAMNTYSNLFTGK